MYIYIYKFNQQPCTCHNHCVGDQVTKKPINHHHVNCCQKARITLAASFLCFHYFHPVSQLPLGFLYIKTEREEIEKFDKNI